MYSVRNRIIIFLSFVYSLALPAQEVKNEDQIKAAYLVTFLKYMKIEEDFSKPIILTVIGENPFDGELKKFDGKRVKGRELKVIYLDKFKDKVPKSELVYICDSEILSQKVILSLCSKNKTLTIADNEFFLKSGGMINLVNHAKKIKWEVNYKAIKEAEVGLSSKVLRLAVNKRGP